MSQFAFEWRQPTSYAPEDFIVSASNEEAARFLDFWPNPKSGTVLLWGEAGAGKTHLVHRWLARTHGMLLENSMIGKISSEQLWQKDTPAVLENIETLKDETALFHLLRYVETANKNLLITAGMPAKELPFGLPDLTSRLCALPAMNIKAPDHELLHIFIVKCFSDRQLSVSEEVIQYLLMRTERSFVSINNTINTIEKASMESKRNITVPLLKKLLD